METKNIALTSLGALFLMMLVTPVVFSQSTGLLKGKISDINGDGIDYAQVIVTKDAERRVIAVDKDGKYEVVLPEGEYTVTGQARVFHPSEARKVMIRSGQDTLLNHFLEGNPDNVVCTLLIEAAKEEKLATVEVDVKIVKVESKDKQKMQKRRSTRKEKLGKAPLSPKSTAGGSGARWRL